MLMLTPQALAVVQKVTAHPRLGKRSGLRIAGDPEAAPLQVCAVTGPRSGDQVVERDGARIFVGGGAGRRLRGARLDVLAERNGRIHFVVSDPR